ncbi:MAG: ABC transporter ATP-binding protein [Planctomycetes bacterium]|nr:ABC transporter ATP-binding protein [Planctomycetota bacterium]
MEPAIETRELTVRYPTGGGIESISLRVERGEVMGFLGKNGAGKTTTIRVLLDLLRPDSGSARVLGSDVRAGAGALRARIGYLPGDLALPPGCTGAQALDLFARLQRKPPVDRDRVLDRLGFPRHALQRSARGYSTGMRQMIGITLALQHHPELLILDEPTSGLDPVVRDAFLALVREARDGGQTVFLSSHVLDEVERGADRVAIVHDGRLRHVGSVAELRAQAPRQATLRWRDGTTTTLDPATDGAATSPLDGLLARVHAAAAARPGELLDIAITAPGLDELFRAVIARPGEAPT